MSTVESRVESLRTEVRKLIDWAFGNAAYYKKNAPGLVDDIRGFEDCAATLDAFQAGLSVVPPHPALHIELVRWVKPTTALPDSDETVLLIVNSCDGVSMGYLDGEKWRDAEGFPHHGGVLFWAEMVSGPQPAPALEEAEL